MYIYVHVRDHQGTCCYVAGNVGVCVRVCECVLLFLHVYMYIYVHVRDHQGTCCYVEFMAGVCVRAGACVRVSAFCKVLYVCV